MPRSPNAPAPSTLLVAAAFLVAAAMLFLGLGRPALMWPDEGRNAEVAREMAESGSWWEPTIEGLPYLDKPATFFAAVAASIRVFGATEGAARLPSALCGFGALVAVFAVLRRRAGANAAALAVVAATTCPMVFGFSRLVIMDMMLAFCTTCAILAAFTAEERDGPERTRRYLLASAAAGAGFVVKGPVGVLVPLAVLVADRLVARTPGALRRLLSPWNGLTFLAIAAPWFIGVIRAHPDFFHYGVVEETLGRFFTPAFNRAKPFWFFAPVLIIATLPWCALLVPVGRAVWKSRRTLPAIDRLLCVWAVIVFCFFSLSRTKQPGYILSGVIAIGALVGVTIARAWDDPDAATAKSIARWTGAFGVASAGIGTGLALAAFRPDVLPQRIAPSLTGDTWAAAAAPGCAIGLLLAGAGAIVAFRRVSLLWTALAFAAFPLAVVTLAFPGVCRYAEARSARPIARRLASFPADAEIACVSTYPAGVSFYLGRTLTLLSADGAQFGSNYATYWLRRRKDWPANVVPWKDRHAWLAGRPVPVVLVADAGTRDELAALAREHGASVAELSGEWSAALLAPAGRP